MRFTHAKKRFVSEASDRRILKARDLIASPAIVVIGGEIAGSSATPTKPI